LQNFSFATASAEKRSFAARRAKNCKSLCIEPKVRSNRLLQQAQRFVMIIPSKCKQEECMTKKISFGKMMSVAVLLTVTIFGCTAEKNQADGNRYEWEDVNTFLAVLEENPDGVLANRNGDKIRTQIMTFQFVDESKLYFGTNSEKPLYKQLLENPHVSYCIFPDDFEPVVSFNGTVVFVEDLALKARALNEGEYLKNHYKSPDDPQLKLFYIDVEEIETYGNDGAHTYRARK
jgi:uncharacterized pyridoxamine 5'-phosphate oxidase family protein